MGFVNLRKSCKSGLTQELVAGYLRRPRVWNWLQLACQTLLLFVGVYVATLLLFYALPAAVVLGQGFFRFEWVTWLMNTVIHAPLTFALFMVFSGFSAVLFLAMPAGFVACYFYSGSLIWQNFAAQHGKKLASLGSAATLLIWLVGVWALRRRI